MPEDELMTSLSALMEIDEALARQISISAAITLLPFEDVTPELWESVQNAQGENRDLLELFRQGMTEGSKLVANDAVTAHINAVITSD